MNKRKATVQTNEKREKGKKLDKRRNWIICESDSRPMRRLHQHFREKALEKGGKSQSFWVNFNRFSERARTFFMKTIERIFLIKMECLYLMNGWTISGCSPVEVQKLKSKVDKHSLRCKRWQLVKRNSWWRAVHHIKSSIIWKQGKLGQGCLMALFFFYCIDRYTLVQTNVNINKMK